jgi:hypothetical protein
MRSTPGEAVDAIDRALAQNTEILGIGIHVQGVGETALTGVMAAGDESAVLIADRTGLDTVVIAGAEGDTPEEGAVRAALAARDAFLGMPANVRDLTQRVRDDMYPDSPTEQEE